MKDDDVLEQLRDIHVAAELSPELTPEFAVWPFIVLALVVLAIGLARLWNRNRWRRHARADLAHLLATEDQAMQWSGLLAFACGLSSRSGRSVTLPETAFVPPETITDQQRSEFISFLGAELRR